ncbi:MAG TPA: hypothetical protein PL009_12970 [Flavipsychrobacter sp.]|nr:hypothetical protein [Flavipsychrobacter sp.]
MISRKKTIAITGLVVATAALVLFQSSAPPPSGPDFDFEQEPPVVEKYFVQKLSSSIDNYSMIMKIKYLEDDRLADLHELNIYYGVDEIT